MVGAVAISPQDRRFRARELRNRPHQRLQHGFEVEIGAAYRAQHLGGRGLQLLRVAQLGDVADRADHPPDAAGPVAQRDTVLVRPAPFAVARPIAVLAIETRLLAAEQGSPGPAIGRQVVGIDAARPILDRAQPLVFETEHRAQLRRVIDRSVCRVVVVNRLVDRFERERVALGAGRRQGRVMHVRRNPFGSSTGHATPVCVSPLCRREVSLYRLYRRLAHGIARHCRRERPGSQPRLCPSAVSPWAARTCSRPRARCGSPRDGPDRPRSCGAAG